MADLRMVLSAFLALAGVVVIGMMMLSNSDAAVKLMEGGSKAYTGTVTGLVAAVK